MAKLLFRFVHTQIAVSRWVEKRLRDTICKSYQKTRHNFMCSASCRNGCWRSEARDASLFPSSKSTSKLKNEYNDVSSTHNGNQNCKWNNVSIINCTNGFTMNRLARPRIYALQTFNPKKRGVRDRRGTVEPKQPKQINKSLSVCVEFIKNQRERNVESYRTGANKHKVNNRRKRFIFIRYVQGWELESFVGKSCIKLTWAQFANFPTECKELCHHGKSFLIPAHW